MNQKIVVRVALLLTAAAVVFSLVWSIADRKQPLSASIDIAAGEDGTFYSLCKDDRGYYVQAVGKDGTLVYQTRLAADKRTVFYEYSYIAVDKNGNCYVAVEETDIIAGSHQQYVQKLSAFGALDTVLFAPEGMFRGGVPVSCIRSIAVYGDAIVITQICDEKNTFLKRSYYPRADQYLSAYYVLEQDTRIFEICVAGNGVVYFIDDNSALNKVDAAGGFEKIELPEKCAPITLSSDAEGNLYFTDGHSMDFYKYQADSNSVTKIYSAESTLADGRRFEQTRNIRYSGGVLAGFFPETQNAPVTYAALSADSMRTVSNAVLPFGATLLRFLQRSAVCAGALLLLAALVFVFIYARKLRVKLLVVIIPLVFVMLVAVFFVCRSLFADLVAKEERENLAAILSLTFAPDAVKYVDFPESRERQLFATLYYWENGIAYVALDYPYGGTPRHTGVRADYFIHARSDLFVTSELLGADGNAMGYAEVGMNPILLAYEVTDQSLTLILPISLFLILIVCCLLLLLQQPLNGLRELNEAVSSMAEGDFSAKADIRTGDEFEDIGNAFNRMSFRLKKYFDSMHNLNDAYEKFIPAKIFKLLHKDTILDVKLGDHAMANISYVSMFTTGLSLTGESQDVSEKFQLIHTAFSVIVSNVERTAGTIERFSHSGATAIYDVASAGDAVLALLGILEGLRNDPATTGLSMSFVIRNCEAMVGVVGDKYRMATAVVFESSDIAARLRGFMADAGIKILVTEDVHAQLAHHPYTFRLAGGIQSEGKPVHCYDVIESYQFAERQNKLITKDMFEAAVTSFLAGDYKTARKGFIQVLKIDPRDEAAKAYVFMCDEGGKDMKEGALSV